jgi:hypothetical protein
MVGGAVEAVGGRIAGERGCGDYGGCGRRGRGESWWEGLWGLWEGGELVAGALEVVGAVGVGRAGERGCNMSSGIGSGMGSGMSSGMGGGMGGGIGSGMGSGA